MNVVRIQKEYGVFVRSVRVDVGRCLVTHSAIVIHCVFRGRRIFRETM